MNKAATKRFHIELAAGRAAIALDPSTIAMLLGLSNASYRDLEWYENEWLTVAPAIMLRGLIHCFRIDWRACHAWKEGAPLRNVPLDLALAERRTSLGLSREEAANRAGFAVGLFDAAESHSDGLALWPLQVGLLVAEALGLDEKDLTSRLLGAMS